MHREPPHRIVLMATHQVELTIDEYLRKRLMPVEGAIPQLAGIDMYGNSIPAGPVGGRLWPPPSGAETGERADRSTVAPRVDGRSIQ